MRSGLPRRALRRHDDRPVIPFDVWIRLFKVQVRWNLAVLQHQDGFDQAGHTGYCLQMPNIRFDGSDPQRRLPIAIAAVYGA